MVPQGPAPLLRLQVGALRCGPRLRQLGLSEVSQGLGAALQIRRGARRSGVPMAGSCHGRRELPWVFEDANGGGWWLGLMVGEWMMDCHSPPIFTTQHVIPCLINMVEHYPLPNICRSFLGIAKQYYIRNVGGASLFIVDHCLSLSTVNHRFDHYCGPWSLVINQWLSIVQPPMLLNP